MFQRTDRRNWRRAKAGRTVIALMLGDGWAEEGDEPASSIAVIPRTTVLRHGSIQNVLVCSYDGKSLKGLVLVEGYFEERHGKSLARKISYWVI